MIVRDKIKKEEIEMPFTKAVVDIKKEIVSIKCDLYIDCAEELIKQGSDPSDLWGFNIYPDSSLDFISLINVRPLKNRSMDIQDEEIRQKIEAIIKNLMV
jgi:hypothetical protein